MNYRQEYYKKQDAMFAKLAEIQAEMQAMLDDNAKLLAVAAREQSQWIDRASLIH